MAIEIDKRGLPPTPPLTVAKASQTAAPGQSQHRRGDQPKRSDGSTPGKIDYASLAARLNAGDRDPDSLNTLGVCYLRLGNISEAVRIYRGLALQPGCTWERTDIPAVYKRNFATTLLLAGLPAGCLAVLRSGPLADHPRSQELFAAIKNWERSLTFVQRWDWRLNGVAPKDCRVPIDFEPGEFE